MKSKLKNNLRLRGRQLTTLAGDSTLLVLILMLTLMACTTNDAAHEHDAYTCPMHPTVVADKPGTCPVCGMALVRKARLGEEVKITDDLGKLLKSPNETVLTSIKMIKGEYQSLPAIVNAQGIVTYDTRKIYTIPSRTGGRLERTYLTYEFQPVTKGQRVADIYSPELITAQRELIFLLQNDGTNESLIEAARRKLELLGMTTGQINAIVKNREVGNTISVLSPYSGYVITGSEPPSAPIAMTPAPTSGGMGNGMTNSSTSGTAGSQKQSTNNADGRIIREGDYVNAGETLYTIVNPKALRIELNLPGNYTGTIKEGSKVRIQFSNDRSEVGTVDFIQPFFGDAQEFIKIRVYVTKMDDIYIGQLVTASITLEPVESLWVPKEAVLDLGNQKIVFRNDRGFLKPKSVTTGVSVQGMTEIKHGLTSSEEIAANAQYLVDSESFIRVED